MIVETAELADLPGFLTLAAEVESWFGPMVDNPDFHAALDRGIRAGQALCARGEDSKDLLGAVLLGGHYPVFRITWLVVAAAARRQGVGRALVAQALTRMSPRPCRVEVMTFGADHPGAEASGARVFYEALGFRPGESAPAGPDGGSRQWFCRTLISGRSVDLSRG